MGMDLIGRNEGSYFRANWWFWRPIWWSVYDFRYYEEDEIYGLVYEKKLLSDEKLDYGNWNNGSWLTKDEALKIAKTMRSTIDSGALQEYHKRRPNKDDYPFDLQLMEKFCWFCEESGGFGFY